MPEFPYSGFIRTAKNKPQEKAITHLTDSEPEIVPWRLVNNKPQQCLNKVCEQEIKELSVLTVHWFSVRVRKHWKWLFSIFHLILSF